MASIESILANAVSEGKITNAVVFATNGDGSFKYSNATGAASLEANAPPVTEDSLFFLASSTKFFTSIAALQTVEKGLVTLDEDLSAKLPELGQKKILTAYDDANGPTLTERTKPITLRHLLSHTSGIPYDASSELTAKYRDHLGKPRGWGATVSERAGWPLMFEPGSQWAYSMGLDWAGKLVETLNGGGDDLDTYMQENIFARVGATGITFWPEKRAGLKGREVALSVRTPGGKLAPFTGAHFNAGATDAFGGHGAYASMKDYIKVLQSILAQDGKLLRPETAALLFAPQLSPGLEASLAAYKASPGGQLFVGEFTPGIPLQHGLGGILFTESDVGKRRAGTLSWGGLFNTFWLIDRQADLALTFGTQVLPCGDKAVAHVISQVEKAVYSLAGKSGGEGCG